MVYIYIYMYMYMGPSRTRNHLAGWFKDVPFDVEALREQPGDPEFAMKGAQR